MVSQHLARLTACQSTEGVWALHTKKLAEYGFDRLIYGLTRFRSGNSLGDPEDLLVLSNHSSDYLERFFGDNMFYAAPMVRWSLENTGPCSWRWIDTQVKNGTLSKAELAVVDFNHQMGVTAGYTVSFRSVSHREAGGMALTAREGLDQDAVDAIWAEHGLDILVMCNVLHLKIVNLPTAGPLRRLTPRQKEVLEWVSQGKTIQDAAVIMGLKPATIEKHMRLARISLDVETTAQAVLKASAQNQIFVFER